MKSEQKSKQLKVYVPLTIVVLLVIIGGWLWYRDYSSYITTDDAHVDADNVNISPKMLGRVAALNREEGQPVEKGEILALLDSNDLVAQRNQTLALKQQGEASLAQTRTKYSSDQKSIRVLEIGLERAAEDLDRAKKQSAGGVITAEQLSHAQKAWETAAAQLDASRSQLEVSKASIASASAAVETAAAQIKVLDAQIGNMRLYAPSSGVVSRKWVMTGDIVQPGQAVYTVTISKNQWISAFLEETKIAEIHQGQPVKFSIDAFPGVTFRGKVSLVGSTTASVFSLIPANNASGNFTKVTQRIPVRISIESADDRSDLSAFNILSGMSAEVKIIKDK
jgi:membrane fusion protein (multidrug efflux system)